MRSEKIVEDGVVSIGGGGSITRTSAILFASPAQLVAVALYCPEWL